MRKDKRLTDVELELMMILWRIGEGSVNDVIAQLPKGRELAYTSVSTMLRILEQKEALSTRKEGRGHVYIPMLKKAEYETAIIKHMVENVFDGTPMALVTQLIGSVKMEASEVEQLKQLLDQMTKKK